jgi:hypothetical protein
MDFFDSFHAAVKAVKAEFHAELDFLRADENGN